MNRDVRKMSARQHILRYPEAYLGSVHPSNNGRLAYNTDGDIVTVTGHVPAAIRAFKEILDNSVDAASRTGFKSGLNISCLFDSKGFTVVDDGHGIPIKKADGYDVYMPQLALGENRAGSNFDDEDRSTIGMYGVGAYCTNVVSKGLYLRTTWNKQVYTQYFSENCGKIEPPEITKASNRDRGTSVNVEFDNSIIQWGEESIYCCLQLLNNVMFVYPQIKITAEVDGKKVRLLSGSDYHVALGLSDPWFTLETGSIRGVFGLFDGSVKTRGLVNGTECTGIHLTTLKSMVSGEVISSLQTEVPDATRADISKCLSGVVSFRIESPGFGSLTKTDLVSCNMDRLKEDISEAMPYIKQGLLQSAQFKHMVADLVEKRGGKKLKTQERKAARKRKATKLIDTYGRKKAGQKTYLLITEGDSAKGMFVQVRDPAMHAIYPLRGKIMNAVTAADTDKVAGNKVLFELASILGLSFTDDDISGCRYDYVVALTDADPDGDSICGLIYGFLDAYWPALFEEGRVLRLCTPSHIGVTSRTRKHFYSGKIPKGFKGKLEYIKGLAALTKDDVRTILNEPQFETMIPDPEAPALMNVVLGSASDEKRAWLS